MEFLARGERDSAQGSLDKRILVVLTRYVIFAENAAGKSLLAVKLQKPF